MSVLTDGSLEVKLPTYGQMQQQLWEQSEKRESVEWRSEKRKSQRRERERARGKKIKGREKVEKSRNTVFFRCFVALEGRKVPLKRRVRSHLQGWKIMARSAFGSQHAKNASASEHLWRLRCSKSARDLAQSTCRRQHVKIASASKHFWMFRRRFMWQAQWMLHLAKSEPNMWFCSIFKNHSRRETRDMLTCTRLEVAVLISWERLHFGASGLQAC